MQPIQHHQTDSLAWNGCFSSFLCASSLTILNPLSLWQCIHHQINPFGIETKSNSVDSHCQEMLFLVPGAAAATVNMQGTQRPLSFLSCSSKRKDNASDCVGIWIAATVAAAQASLFIQIHSFHQCAQLGIERLLLNAQASSSRKRMDLGGCTKEVEVIKIYFIGLHSFLQNFLFVDDPCLHARLVHLCTCLPDRLADGPVACLGCIPGAILLSCLACPERRPPEARFQSSGWFRVFEDKEDVRQQD